MFPVFSIEISGEAGYHKKSYFPSGCITMLRLFPFVKKSGKLEGEPVHIESEDRLLCKYARFCLLLPELQIRGNIEDSSTIIFNSQ